ncbi:MAG: D-alanyl-D-alanine carboxypeptidase family protein [Thermocrispum sp.]
MFRPSHRAPAALLCGVLLAGAAAPAHAAQPSERPKPCSNEVQPPHPVDTSEVPRPGQRAPEPLPVPEEPVGGPRLGGCLQIVPDSPLRVPRRITAASWLLADLDTGAVLAAKDPHARHRPASLIKVLLALVVLDELDPDLIVRATKSDASQECTCIGIRRGQRYPVHKLFTGLLIRSGNDAAHTLGTALGGIDKALAKMNALARELRALDTRAATVSGLDGPGMSSSAYDQALILRAAMEQPRFAKAVRTRELRFRWHRRKQPITLYNDNRLLSGPEAYPGFLGGKTGFTDDARHTYLGTARRDGKRLAVILMRAEAEPERPSAQARRLLDYGFRLAARDTEPVGELVDPTPAAAGKLEEPGEQPGKEPAKPAAAPDDGASSTPWIVGLLVIGTALAGGFLLRRKPRR